MGVPMSDRGARPWLESDGAGRPGNGAENTGNGAGESSPRGFVDLGGPSEDAFEAGVERLREEARRAARADAASGVPDPGTRGPTESELELRNRALAFFERWRSRENRRVLEEVAAHEERITESLSQVSLGVDRLQRLTNEMIRLKARYEVRKHEVTRELSHGSRQRDRGLPTPVYAVALVFLGLVEFFANAPVFSALLPRDPLTERQIRLLTETSTGWMAGFERVVAHIVFRPDAALLAAGVITFLCVLAHFFGHSLRDLMMQGQGRSEPHTVQSRSARENVVPLVLSAIGLVLTLGVLYEARVQLGEVGLERFTTDMAQVEELRRDAGWLRVDGDLLGANELTDRADDMEEAADELREYSQSMARMNLPILLLNLTLVLCAISAAYFHRRDGRTERFNEMPFEDDRRAFLAKGEEVAKETSPLLSRSLRDTRALQSALHGLGANEWRAALHQLESIFATYRAENGRARQIDPHTIAAFRTPMRFEPDDVASLNGSLTVRDPADYERERAALAQRFEDLRARFNEEASSSW